MKWNGLHTKPDYERFNSSCSCFRHHQSLIGRGRPRLDCKPKHAFTTSRRVTIGGVLLPPRQNAPEEHLSRLQTVSRPAAGGVGLEESFQVEMWQLSSRQFIPSHITSSATSVC